MLDGSSQRASDPSQPDDRRLSGIVLDGSSQRAVNRGYVVIKVTCKMERVDWKTVYLH